MSLSAVGEVLPSIDAFDVRYSAPGAPEFGVPWTRGTPGSPTFRSGVSADKVRLPSGTTAALQSFGNHVAIEGNVSRFRHWHSVDGVADGMEALEVANKVFFDVMPEMPPAIDSAFLRRYATRKRGEVPVLVAPDFGADLFRVDVCNTYSSGSKANALEFLRQLSLRKFAGVSGFLYANGRTVFFRGPDWTVTYYLKGWEPEGKGAASAPFASEREALRSFLRAVGAVRHEVRFSRKWLQAHGMRRPSAWTAETVAARLSEYAPHLLLGDVRRYEFAALRAALESRGEPARRINRLCEYASLWAQGAPVRDMVSRWTWYRLRDELAEFGIDLESKPDPERLLGVEDCGLRPLVLPPGFHFRPEVCS